MKQILFLLLLLSIGFVSFAQNPEIPTLPGLKIETKDGYNHLSWVSEYDRLKSVQILRSQDSVLSFIAIGNIAKPKKGVQKFVDKNPKLGKNYYKVRVLFASELEWFSNTYKVVLDSATVAASRLRSVSTGSTNSKSIDNTQDNSDFTDFYYEPSTKIYTNPYTGHIMINLEDARQKRYALKFYNPRKEEVLYISRIKKKHIVLDKYNFNAKGTYSFKLMESDEIKETGYITIY
jgi:hypothetical protein